MSNPGVNKNFVVQNGLTVGGVTIFAGNGDIKTGGNITVTGSGTVNVPSIGVSSIAINDSSIAINDTGPTGSTIEFTLDGAITANISASGANLPAGAAYRINQTDVLSATTLKSGVINSSLTSVGTLQNLTVSGNTAINNTLYGRGVYDNSNRVLTEASTTSVLTSVGTLTALTVSGNTAINNTLYGQGVYDNSNRVVSTSSGAGNLTLSGTGINLNTIGPGATTVGSGSAIPVVTTDAYGRVVALTSASLTAVTNLSSSGSGNITVSAATGSVTLALPSTGPGATTVGSSTSVPVITTDAYGRVVALTSSSISTSFTVAGTTGTATVAGGSTLSLAGTYGVTVAVGTEYANIATPQDLQTTASPTFTGLTTSANTIVNSTLYGRGVYDNSNRVVSTSSGAGNLTISGTAITLPSTGPGAASVGSSTAIPVVTTDAYGRVASTSTAAVVAPAGTLSGDTLASGIIHSSLTDVGTLTALTVSGVTKPNANATVALGATNAYWSNFYAVSSNFNQATVGGQGVSSAGIVTITNNSDSTSAASGALQVTGGVGIGANLYVTGISTLRGNVNIGGNLTVTGTSVSIGTSDLAIQDPIINLHTFANLAALTGNDGSDIGIKVHYYDSADRAGFFGRTNADGYFTYWAAGTDAANVFTGTTLGTVKGGAGIFSNSTTSTSTTTGALQVGGGAGIVGNVYSGGVGYFGSASSIALTNPLFVATGNSNNVVQAQLQNTNAGGSASGDIVISADNGTDSANFFNVGINSSGYNDAAFTVQKALDGYMYVNGGNLTVGTQSANKNIVFHTGGTLAAQARAMISDIAFTANGINILPSANVTQNLGSSTAYWGTVFAGQHTGNAFTVGGGGLTSSGNTIVNSTLYAQGVYDNSNRVVSTSSGAGNLSISGTAIVLPVTGPGAASVGGSTAIPVITTDAYGRVASTSTAAVVAPAGTLSGATLASGVTASSLTSVGTLTGLTVSGSITPNANLTVNLGNSTSYYGTTYTGGLSANTATIGAGGVTSTGNIAVNTATDAAITTTTTVAEIFNSGATTLKIGGAATTINIGATTGSIVPAANAAVNLGSSTAYWGTVFAGQHTGNAFTAGAGGVTSTGNIAVNTATNAGLTTSAATAFLFSESVTSGHLFKAATTISVGAVGTDTLTYNATAGSLVPGANTAVNLGSSTAYWGTTFTGQVTANTIVASAGTANAAVLTGNVNVAGWIMPFTSNATYNLGTSTRWWNTFYGVSTQAQYADLAENYQADAIYEPGTVLMFGGEAEVTVADPDTTAVAGVVSTNPAHLMNGALQGARVVALALQGRVPCRVIGPVAKGDILVSAGFGYAKAAPDRQLGMRFGQAIGKALENVDPGTKATIEVVVGRV